MLTEEGIRGRERNKLRYSEEGSGPLTKIIKVEEIGCESPGLHAEELLGNCEMEMKLENVKHEAEETMIDVL